MDKFSFIALWDAYNGLLTRTQQDITDLYFNKDLTVSEIAEEKKISRQAVSECLKGCKNQLEEYEEKLHLCERIREICLEQSFLLTGAAKWAESFKKARPEFTQDIENLEFILNKDYSKEAEAELNKPQTQKLLTADYTKEVYGSPKTGEE